MPSRKLLIAYFPRRATRADLKGAFQHLAKIQAARIVADVDGQPRCYGFLEFYNDQDATLAFKACERGEIQLVDEFSKTWYLKAQYANGKRSNHNRRGAAANADSNSSTDASHSGATDFARSDFSRNCTDDVDVGGRHRDYMYEMPERDSACDWKSELISKRMPTDNHMRDVNFLAPCGAHICDKTQLQNLHKYSPEEVIFGDSRNKRIQVGNPHQQRWSNGSHDNRATAGAYSIDLLNKPLLPAKTFTNVSDGVRIENLHALRERLANDIRGGDRRETPFDHNANLQNSYRLTPDETRPLHAHGACTHHKLPDQEHAPKGAFNHGCHDNGRNGGLNDLRSKHSISGLSNLESQYTADRHDKYFSNRIRGSDNTSRCVAGNVYFCDPRDTSVARTANLDNIPKCSSDNDYGDRYGKFTNGVVNSDAPRRRLNLSDSRDTRRSSYVYFQDLRALRTLENVCTVESLNKPFSNCLVGDDYHDAYIAKQGHACEEPAAEDIDFIDPYSTFAAEDKPLSGPQINYLLADGDSKRGQTGAYCGNVPTSAILEAGDDYLVNMNRYEELVGVTFSL